MLKEVSNFQATLSPMIILISIGRLCIQSFFTIGGFLVGVKFLKADSEVKLIGILKAVTVRYVG